jgi:aspartate aminotransferase
MTVETVFASVEACPADPIMDIMDKYSRDTYSNKIDVSVGVYKSEDGSVFTLPSIKEAKRRLADNDPGHSYTNMRGIPEYIDGAKQVIFGPAGASPLIASLQTISGTGAIHMGLAFLNELQRTKYVIGVPAWDNYIPMIKHMGGEVQTYRHYDPQTGGVDFDALLTAIKEAPTKSTFILQACCHNPTGADYSREQWKEIACAISKYNHFTLFDIAYQGLSSGSLDEDAWPVRYFMEKNMEFMVCQSFSKNLGLYGERAGCLHVVGRDSEHVQNVQSQLVSLFRMECSFAPAFGARLVVQITTDKQLRSQWHEEVSQMSARIIDIRNTVLDKLVKLETPGKWDHVVKQKGMFWYSGLSQDQVHLLINDHHVYMTLNGRVNVTGLNSSNIDLFCRSIDTVVRATAI